MSLHLWTFTVIFSSSHMLFHSFIFHYLINHHFPYALLYHGDMMSWVFIVSHLLFLVQSHPRHSFSLSRCVPPVPFSLNSCWHTTFLEFTKHQTTNPLSLSCINSHIMTVDCFLFSWMEIWCQTAWPMHILFLIVTVCLLGPNHMTFTIKYRISSSSTLWPEIQSFIRLFERLLILDLSSWDRLLLHPWSLP